MSSDTSGTEFISKDMSTPKEVQIVESSSNLDNLDACSISSKSSRGSRGGRRRSRRSPQTEDSPDSAPEVTTIVIPLVEPKEEVKVDKVSDLVEQMISQIGPLVQNEITLSPEVKDADTDQVVLNDIGFQLPVYTEDWISFEGIDSSEAYEEPVSNNGYFHKSATGLSSREIHPLLLDPCTSLANYQRYTYKDGSLVGTTHIRGVKLPARRLLSRNAAKAVEGEAVLRFFTRLDVKDPDRIRYFENLRVIRFYAATWDALMFAYQLVRTTSTVAEKTGRNISWRVNSDLKRQIDRFRIELIHHPYKTAKKLKELAGHARSWFFGGPRPKQPLLRTIPCKYYALVFSYMGRALPPQARSDVNAGYQMLVNRLTSEPPDEVPAWRGFVRRYLEKFSPKNIENMSYPTDASAGAALGYTRAQGGFSRATQDLVGLGFSLMKMEPRPGDDAADITECMPWTYMRQAADFKQSGNPDLLKVGDIDLERLNRISGLQRLYSRALNRAVEWTMARFEHIPFVALSAPEPGLKTRYPTLAPAAVLHISQVLRRAADAHLKMDKRSRESLGGKPEIKLGSLPGPWYSQDLTSATDLHPFWLQRGFYEILLEAHPKIAHLSDHLPKLFGPRKLISPDTYSALKSNPDFVAPTNPVIDLLTMDWEKALPNLATPAVYFRKAKARPNQVGLKAAKEYVAQWEKYWDVINNLPGIMTTTGDPMGEAASFPLLNIGTTFSAERAGLRKHANTGDDARIPLGQKGRPSVLQEPAEERSSKMNALLARLPATHHDWSPLDKLAVHELALSEIGAVLSRGDPKEGKPNKIFIHPRYSLYKEMPMDGDHKLPFIPVKLLSAPPGGAKGSISWFNQPTAVRQHCVDFQFHLPLKLWRKLPYWNETLAAFSYGIPVREPVMFGGINHPAFPHAAGTNPRVTQRWLSTLSSLSLVEWATGTGLSPLPPAESNLTRHASKEWLKSMVASHKDAVDGNSAEGKRLARLGFDPELRGPLPTLKEAVEEATRYSSSHLLYGHGPMEFLATPSIQTVAHKFHRKLKRGSIYLRKRANGSLEPLTYRGTMEDVAKKNSVYLLDPDVHIPKRQAPRAYGLVPSSFDKDRKPWHWDWLERSQSSDNFIRLFAEALEGKINPSGV